MNEFKFVYANPVQEQFIWNTATESCFDGGFGNGKTTGGILRLLILASEFPGSRWVVARQEWKTLKNTTYKTFRDKVCPNEWIKDEPGVRTGHDPKTVLVNGSEILWMHLDVADEQTLKSLEINGAFVDQAEEIKPELYEILESRAGRWQRGWPQSCPRYTWIACNPMGHDWIYYRFHPDVRPPGYRGYFFASTIDNKVFLDKVNPGYVDSLLRKPESWQRKYVYGSRDIFEGQIHKGFTRASHVYDHKKFDPLKQRPLAMLAGYFDYGLSSPTRVLIVAFDQEGYRWVVDEYDAANKKISEHANDIKKFLGKFGRKVEWIKADPSVFFTEMRDREGPQSIALDYSQYGIYLLKADNNEDTSIERINELLNILPTRLHPLTRERGSPNLFVSDVCVGLIEELPNQRWKQKRNILTGEVEFVEERDPNLPDHSYDCLRYMANDIQHYTPYHGDMKRLVMSYARAL